MTETDFDFVAARAALDALKAALRGFEPIARCMDEGEVSKHFAEVARSEAAHGSNAPVEGIYPILAAPRVFPDFGARRTDRFAKSANLLLPHPTSHGTHPGTHPREQSLGVSFLGTEPQPSDKDQKGAICLGTCATVAREGSPVPWCMDIHTPDEPAALGFRRVDISTTAASNRHEIMTVAA